MKKLSWYYKKIVFNFKKKIDLDKIQDKHNSLNELFNFYGTDKGTSVKIHMIKIQRKYLDMVLLNSMKNILKNLKMKI